MKQRSSRRSMHRMRSRRRSTRRKRSSRRRSTRRRSTRKRMNKRNKRSRLRSYRRSTRRKRYRKHYMKGGTDRVADTPMENNYAYMRRVVKEAGMGAAGGAALGAAIGAGVGAAKGNVREGARVGSSLGWKAGAIAGLGYGALKYHKSKGAPTETQAQKNVKEMLRKKTPILLPDEMHSHHKSITDELIQKGIILNRAECLAAELVKKNIKSPDQVYKMTETDLKNIGGFTTLDIRKLKKS